HRFSRRIAKGFGRDQQRLAGGDRACGSAARRTAFDRRRARRNRASATRSPFHPQRRVPGRCHRRRRGSHRTRRRRPVAAAPPRAEAPDPRKCVLALCRRGRQREGSSMTGLLAVYHKELTTYFRSPIAYFVLAVFLVGTGYFFTYNMFLTGSASMTETFRDM